MNRQKEEESQPSLQQGWLSSEGGYFNSQQVEVVSVSVSGIILFLPLLARDCLFYQERCCGQAFAQIALLVEKVTAQVSEILSAIQEMAASSSHVVAAMRNIDQVSKHTAAETQNISAATEQSALMEEMAASSQRLAQMALSLENAVRQFRI